MCLCLHRIVQQFDNIVEVLIEQQNFTNITVTAEDVALVGERVSDQACNNHLEETLNSQHNTIIVHNDYYFGHRLEEMNSRELGFQLLEPKVRHASSCAVMNDTKFVQYLTHPSRTEC